MIINAMAVLINGAILYGLVTALQRIFSPDLSWLPSIMANSPVVMVIVIMVFVIMISLTPAADMLLRLSYGFRKPLRDEKEKLETIFKKVCMAAQKEPSNYLLYIVDDAFPNAYALGNNSIGISRKLLKNYTENEIKGVLAHELGHLHFHDSVKNRIFISSCLIGQGILAMCYALAAIFGVLAKLPIPLMNLLFLLSSWFVGVQVWLIQMCLIMPLSGLAMFFGRENEYRADQYAFDIGQGEGLYSFLRRVLDEDRGQQSGFLSMLHQTHPSTGKRILKIEKSFGKF